MRKQFTVGTQEAAKQLSELIGEPITKGMVLTVTSPKQVVGRECACGCKTKTSGGVWAPGHDATYKSRLFALVRGTDTTQAELAKGELTRLGWPMPSGKKGTAPAPLPLPTASE